MHKPVWWKKEVADDDSMCGSEFWNEGILTNSLPLLIDRNPTLIDFTALAFTCTLLGKGSSGLVYKGEWKKRPVAIKVFTPFEISDKDVESYMQETLMIQQLQAGEGHPFIVEYFGLCVCPPDICLVFEYCEKGDLAQVLAKEKQLPWAIKMKFAIECASAVAYMHSKKLVHRDIKSQNFLVSADWACKLADLGLARTAPTRDAVMSVMAGTVGYLSPEIMQRKKYDSSSDVFALAIVLWEIATQEQPFKGLQDEQIEDMICEGIRPSWKDKRIPFEYQLLLERAWSAEPAERPSALELMETLRTIASELPGISGSSFSQGSRQLSASSSHQLSAPIRIAPPGHKSASSSPIHQSNHGPSMTQETVTPLEYDILQARYDALIRQQEQLRDQMDQFQMKAEKQTRGGGQRKNSLPLTSSERKNSSIQRDRARSVTKTKSISAVTRGGTFALDDPSTMRKFSLNGDRLFPGSPPQSTPAHQSSFIPVQERMIPSDDPPLSK